MAQEALVDLEVHKAEEMERGRPGVDLIHMIFLVDTDLSIMVLKECLAGEV